MRVPRCRHSICSGGQPGPSSSTRSDKFRVQSRGGQPHGSRCPLTSVVEQIAQQFQQVVPVAGEQATDWIPGSNRNIPVAMDTSQGFDQIGDFPFQQHPLAGHAAAGDPRPLEFAFGQGADVLKLLAQWATIARPRAAVVRPVGSIRSMAFSGHGPDCRARDWPAAGAGPAATSNRFSSMTSGRTSSGASTESCGISPCANRGSSRRICSNGARPRRTTSRWNSSSTTKQQQSDQRLIPVVIFGYLAAPE
jgi:hypothetical protein